MRDKSKLFPQFLFRSYVSHTYLFPRTTTTATGRTRASTRLTPTKFAKPPDEAMTILELLSLHLSVDGLARQGDSLLSHDHLQTPKRQRAPQGQSGNERPLLGSNGSYWHETDSPEHFSGV